MSEGEFKLEFVESMRSTPADRRKFFEYLCRKDEGRRFGDGQAGLQLYQTFLECVRKVGPEEGVREYQNFFLPKLDQELLRKKTLAAPQATSKNEAKETPSPVNS